jgi:glycosyltransferase involved in cell wall biosynthesis
VGLRLVVVARLSDAKLRSKLRPLLALPEVEELALVRRRPLALDRVVSLCPPAAIADVAAISEPLRALSLLRRCLVRPRPSALIAFYFVPHVAYIETARRLFGIPTIPVAISAEDVERAASSPFYARALREAHAVGVRGEGSRQRLVAGGLRADRVFVPPNAFEASPFEPRPHAGLEHELVFVGDLVEVKRLDWLLEAVAAARRTRPGLRLALVGDGPLRQALAARAEQPDLRGAVSFLGALPAEGVARALRASRALVLTSRYEGLPMSMLEAFCCGVPAIVPDVGDVTSVARDGENALVLGAPGVAAYAAAIERLLGDDELRARLAEGALRTRERVLGESSLEAGAAAWRAALRGL